LYCLAYAPTKSNLVVILLVDDDIRFVSQKSKEKLKSSDSSDEDEKESNEPDYDEDKIKFFRG
jgi:hypothetical protein